MTLPLAALLAAVASVGIIGALLWSRLPRHFADHPNPRSLHRVPVPRIGGLGILAAVLPAVFWQPGLAMALVGTAIALLGLVSLADDVRALPAAARLAAHALAATILVGGCAAAGLAGETLPMAMLLAVGVGIVWMTNLYNFMDGANGLAGGMATIGFGAFAWAAGEAGLVPLALVAATASGASLGFLVFNFPVARVFLGDAGSIPLGFLAGALGWLGERWGAWPPWFPVLVFSPFIVDASVTLALRAWRREPLFRAHQSHHYQRLILGGWSHSRLAASAWLLMALAAGTALLARKVSGEAAIAIIVGWAAIYAALIGAVRRNGSGSSPGRSTR